MVSDASKTPDHIPVFAVVGHPNEGKSSVVSTLSEDDSVRITPTPGETVVCHAYPVVIDGKEIIRFVDTPGFQLPKKTLAWFRAYDGPDAQLVSAFRKAVSNDPDFKDECELLSPIEEGAGIIYVVDGSRPLRGDDRAEMEILRMTGQPRMAIINCKDDTLSFMEEWKSEFRKHFNIVRVFNAHTATYKERIELLESLKAIDQDWQPALEKVISAFKQDWQGRNNRTAELIVEMLEESIAFKLHQNYAEEAEVATARQSAQTAYAEHIYQKEKELHKKIRKRFKHNIFNLDLPSESIVHKDLFDKRTWQVLGLNPKQLAIAAGVAGGVVGSLLDVAAAGLTFGIFTAIGGLAGAGSVLLGGDKMASIKVKGISIGGYQIQVGPMENPQFMYVLIDRALIFYAHVINWAHGRRGRSEAGSPDSDSASAKKRGFTAHWDEASRKLSFQFFNKVRRDLLPMDETIRHSFLNVIKTTLAHISNR